MDYSVTAVTDMSLGRETCYTYMLVTKIPSTDQLM